MSDPTLDHEYLPMEGYAPFTQLSAELILGKENPAFKEGRVGLHFSGGAMDKDFADGTRLSTWFVTIGGRMPICLWNRSCSSGIRVFP